MTDSGYYRELLRQRIAGRPWLASADVLVGAAANAKGLLELGASRVLAIAGSRGAGALPDEAEVAQIDLGAGGTDFMSAVRSAEAALGEVSAQVQAQIDAFDPAGEARVVAALFSNGRPVAGRRVYGARPASWQALEDKTLAEGIWDATEVHRTQSGVFPPDFATLWAGAATIDQGLGTVWSGDAREGFNGGASYVRWVREAAQGREAAEFFAQHCDGVRVMPFLEGVPCSIHGIVLPDAVVAVRPCEMLVFRRPGQALLAYAGAGTFWDPPAADRAYMRGAVRRVGAYLRETVGYRGVFTLDGVMSAEGFRPTEINPRYGAALGVMAGGMPDLPLYLLHLAIAEGEPFDWRAEDLEGLLVASGDGHRRGQGHQLVEKKINETEHLALVNDGHWRVAEEGEAPHARLMLGPHVVGGFLRGVLEPEHTPIGPSAAPRLAEVFAFGDLYWNLGLGPRIPAEDVRR